MTHTEFNNMPRENQYKFIVAMMAFQQVIPEKNENHWLFNQDEKIAIEFFIDARGAITRAKGMPLSKGVKKYWRNRPQGAEGLN